MKYYAGYDSMITDVIVFNSRSERDSWVGDENSAFTRVALTRKEVFAILGRKFEVYIDELNRVWMLNPYNLA